MNRVSTTKKTVIQALAWVTVSFLGNNVNFKNRVPFPNISYFCQL